MVGPPLPPAPPFGSSAEACAMLTKCVFFCRDGYVHEGQSISHLSPAPTHMLMVSQEVAKVWPDRLCLAGAEHAASTGRACSR